MGKRQNNGNNKAGEGGFEKQKESILLVDGSSILHRAYFGISRNRRFTAPDGTPTGAVFTFLNMLFSYVDKLEPKTISVCFDLSGPTFRHELYQEYKAGRKEMEEDLALQFPLVKEVLGYLGYKVLEAEGFEADDLIATLSKKASDQGSLVYILSGDRDLWQLISDTVYIIYPYTKKGMSAREIIDGEMFFEAYGFPPEQLLDYKGLKGDSSDNIPGVKGIGEKTATNLISEYGTLDQVYANLDEIKGATKKRLEEGKESAYLSYDLARLNFAAPVDWPQENNMIDKDALSSFFSRLNIKSFNKRFDLEEEGISEVKDDWTTISDIRDFLEDNKKFYLTSLGEQYFALLNEQKQLFLFEGSSLREVWNLLLENDSELVLWAGKELIRDWQLAIPSKVYYDAEIAAYLLSQLKQDVFEKAFPQAFLQATGENLLLSTGLETASLEELKAEAALRLFALKKLEERQIDLLKEQNMYQLAFDLEFPLNIVLTKMEREGIHVDIDSLKILSKKMGEEIANIERQIYFYLGEEINLNSSKQLGEVLFEKMGLKGGKKTKTGAYSTAADVLENLLDSHPVIALILEYREISKLKSTFVDGLYKEISPAGKIHTHFKQTLTTTGRLSSAEPNLQNIPIRSDWAKAIRNLFVSRPGYSFIDADYSQIELRLLAELSEDKNLKDSFIKEEDIHLSTAAKLFSKDPAEVDGQERRDAKTVNFSIIYGISDFGLARDLGISVNEARAYIKAYDLHYPQVRPWMEEQVTFAKESGYVETILHRRRYIPELKSKNFHQRKFGERAAMNAPVQGSAADLIKLAMVKVDEEFVKQKLAAKIILQVHDELLIECPDEEVDKVSRIVKERMENAMALSIPLLVDYGAGKSWGEIKER